MSPPDTTRFAPSPTGRLHIGHAHAALFAARIAAARPGGRFLLRIEDIDQGRCRAAFAAGIAEDLAWLGLCWEQPMRRQSEHLAAYAGALDRLRADGLVYPCFCTRRQIQAEIAAAPSAPHLLPGAQPLPDGPPYPGTCRGLDPGLRAARMAAGEPFAWRLDVVAAAARTGPLRWHDRGAGWQVAQPALLGDVVLGRKDAPASYHLAVTWDDAVQQVSCVTRGHDLFAATHLHRLLQALLGLPVPAWHHHGLLLDAQGRRFAKRDQAPSLAALRAGGHSPAAVRALAGFPD